MIIYDSNKQNPQEFCLYKGKEIILDDLLHAPFKITLFGFSSFAAIGCIFPVNDGLPQTKRTARSVEIWFLLSRRSSRGHYKGVNPPPQYERNLHWRLKVQLVISFFDKMIVIELVFRIYSAFLLSMIWIPFNYFWGALPVQHFWTSHRPVVRGQQHVYKYT